MNATGALEFQLPILTPSELWQTSGRWEAMGREMFRLKDRHDQYNVLGPTHEEAFTQLLGGLLHSYRDLPRNVYQIHTKFRDEIRPRFGVIRSREFVMKDAYSFDLDEAGLETTYQSMRRAYRRIFARLGLETIPVEADSGSMGGSGSEEFMVASEIGEETLLLSEGGQYRGNQEKTPVLYSQDAKPKGKATTQLSELELVATPGCRTIEQVVEFMKVPASAIAKTVLYRADETLVGVVLRADRQVNEVKLKNALGAISLEPASEADIVSLGSVPGYIAPLGLGDTRLLWDASLNTAPEFVIGSNQKDHHCRGFVPNPSRESQDLALAVAGDPSPTGDGLLREMKGIEVGHIFKLGYKYTKAFNVSVLGEDGRPVVPIMGCYGIGVNRSMATIIEQWHDEKGIRWPISAAPFELCLVGIARGEDEQARVREVYEGLLAAGCEVLWDDRDARPGVKFNDAELIGFPLRLTLGKGYFEKGEAELSLRQSGEQRKLTGDVASVVRGVLLAREELHRELRQAADSLEEALS